MAEQDGNWLSNKRTHVFQRHEIWFNSNVHFALNLKLMKKKSSLSWSQRESNPHLKFRKLLFYPLNYGTECVS
jgi:hypothetical protein